MKRYIALLLLSLSLLAAKAQNIKFIFRNMPDSVMPLLNHTNRADFTDFMDSKMKAVVKNQFHTESEMTVMTTDYIRINTTVQSTWEMKLLPMNDTTRVICVVNTVMAPVADSDIHFYTTTWQPLSTSQFITEPSLDDFFMAPRSSAADSVQTAYSLARRSVDAYLAKASLAKDDTSLTYTFTSPEYQGKEAQIVLKPFVRPSIKFVWKLGRYVIE